MVSDDPPDDRDRDGWEPRHDSDPAESFEVDDLTLIAELTHQMRGAIVRSLKRPRSAAELAEQLDMPVTRLYHHLNRLEAAGLIRVVATRRVGAATERRYQVVAKSFKIPSRVFDDLDRRELSQAMGALFDVAKIGMQKVVESSNLRSEDLHEDALLSLGELTLGPERRAELLTRLKSIIDNFTSEESGERMTLFVAAYPESR